MYDLKFYCDPQIIIIGNQGLQNTSKMLHAEAINPLHTGNSIPYLNFSPIC